MHQSLACLAEFPGAIQNIFRTDEYSERGRYELRLYDGGSRTFEDIVIDDYIPVRLRPLSRPSPPGSTHPAP